MNDYDSINYDETKHIELIKKMVDFEIIKISRIINNNKGLSREIYLKYQKEYDNINKIKSINKKKKKLIELHNKMNETYNDLKQIEIKLAHIIPKIEKVNQPMGFFSIIIADKKEQYGFDRLNSILKITDTKILLKEITEMYQKLDNIIKFVEQIIEDHFKTTFDFQGIKITTDDYNRYYIIFEKNFKTLLETCKIKKFTELLSSTISTVPFEEIIEPKYIGNESELSKIITSGKYPIKDTLKYDINTILAQIGISKEINKKHTIDEIAEYSDNIKELMETIEMLEKFKIKLKNKEENINYIEEMYWRINLNSLEKAHEEITRIIEQNYPNETYVYSSLQIVYNSLGNELRKRLHQELSDNDYKNQPTFVNNVIELIKKYARNKDGNQYSNDEILNFIKQKNQIINSKYASDYFDESYDYGDIDNLMYSFTGKRR